MHSSLNSNILAKLRYRTKPMFRLQLIFQPFFNTISITFYGYREGTIVPNKGSGLSLAYDIVKSNQGRISVKTNYLPPGGDTNLNNISPPGGSIQKVTNYHDPGELRFDVREEETQFVIQLSVRTH